MKQPFQIIGNLIVVILIINSLVGKFPTVSKAQEAGSRFKARLEVRGVEIVRDCHDGKVTRSKKHEFNYSTDLYCEIYQMNLKRYKSNPDFVRNFEGANRTAVLWCENQAPSISDQDRKTLPVALKVHQEEEELIGEKMVTTYLSDGKGSTPDKVEALISAIPKQSGGGYFYRLVVRTYAIIPEGPKPEVKQWDRIKEALVGVEPKYGIRAPNVRVLSEWDFDYSDDKAHYLDIPDAESLEDYLQHPEGQKKLVLEGFYRQSDGTTESETRVDVVFTLNPKPPVEAVIVTDKQYDQWIPTADLKGENRLKVRVKLQKEDGGVPEETAKFKFELIDTSRQRGICTNYPLDGNEDYDLKIEQADNPKLSILNEEGLKEAGGRPIQAGQAAETEGGLKEAEVVISSHDYGAYGGLKVYAYLNTGETLVAYVKNHPDQIALAIPKDDNSNFIADYWENKMGIFTKSYPATWDEDANPAGQRRNGDGYTLYEEYRGFKTLMKEHRRTDPNQKDLFVYDEHGLVIKYYEYDDCNPAKLELHYIDPTMMKFNNVPTDAENRWVNFNSSPDMLYARQYAMHVIMIPPSLTNEKGEYDIGEATNMDNVDYEIALKQPLKYIYVVRISPKVAAMKTQSINDQKLRYEIQEKVVRCSVIHEMGHGMGIPHHRLFGKEDRAERVSGVVDCAMRYNTQDEYNHPESFPSQTRYCGPGEKGIRIILKEVEKDVFQGIGYEECTSHDCFSQIDVKSDP
ncbi:MAG: hypothetical protein ACM3YE_05030 [Bacteroidota bacterium]